MGSVLGAFSTQHRADCRSLASRQVLDALCCESFVAVHASRQTDMLCMHITRRRAVCTEQLPPYILADSMHVHTVLVVRHKPGVKTFGGLSLRCLTTKSTCKHITACDAQRVVGLGGASRSLCCFECILLVAQEATPFVSASGPGGFLLSQRAEQEVLSP